MTDRLVDGDAGAPGSLARRLRFAPLVTLAAVALLVFGAASASALQTHVFSSSFGSAGSGAGQVSSPSGVAVNATTHDVYVADTANLRVDQFSSAGSFIRAWGWGVADGLPSLETCTLTCQAGISGTGAGQFTTPTFIAVDNSAGASAGDVYVGDTGTNQVQKFTASGSLVSAWGSGGMLDGTTATDGPFGALAGIAVDTTGNLNVFDTNTRLFRFAQDGSFITDFTTARGTSSNGLAADAANNFFKVNGDLSVEEFQADGTDIGQVTASTSTTGIITDAATGDLYVDTGAAIEHYTFPACAPAPNAGCTPADTFGSGHLTGAAGLATDPSTGTVYAADVAANQISVFNGAAIPDATTSPASSVSKHTATLNGHLGPAGGGDVSDCHFDYVDDATFEAQGYTGAQTIACIQSTPISSGMDVTAAPSGLNASTTYHFRLVATGPQGTNTSDGATFVTSVAVNVSIAAAHPVGTTTATLNGHVDSNGGGDITDCHFDYTDDTSFQASGFAGAQSVPCAPATPISSPTDVSADLSGLISATPYHARLVATNADGTTSTDDLPFATTGAAIRDEWATGVGPTEATIKATINPNRQQTTFHVDYGPDTTYGQSAPVRDADVGAGSDDLTRAQLLTGLTPGSTYHYRVVATNDAGSVAGPDRLFTTLPVSPPSAACANDALRDGIGSRLPDCRAYEQVSPVDKNGTDAAFLEAGAVTDISRSAVAGGAVVFATFGSVFAGEPSGQTSDYYLSRRGGDGWTTNGINPPLKATAAIVNDPFTEMLFTDALDKAVTNVTSQNGPLLTPDAGLGQFNRYVQDLSDPAHPSYQLLTPPSTDVCTTFVYGASADLSHVIYCSTAKLTTDAVAGAQNLYDWVHGAFRLVSIAPDGTPMSSSDARFAAVPSTISRDGSRIFFQADGNLYLRQDATSTIQIDAAQGAGPGGGGLFLGASDDGSKVVFAAAASAGLTDDTVPGSGQNLYLYDAANASHPLTDLTPAADVNLDGLVGMGTDASYIYYVADGALAPGAQAGDCQASGSGHCDLYVYHAGTTRVVATLSRSGDSSDWAVPGSAGSGGMTYGQVFVTPDGKHMTFRSFGTPTGFDNRPATPGACAFGASDPDEPCSQVYVYDATASQPADRLRCASCNPTGARPLGPASLPVNIGAAGVLAYAPRYLSADGTRLFFNSADSLTGRDTNGLSGCASLTAIALAFWPCQDVYEWEADGAGSCHGSTQNGGCLSLISSGSSDDTTSFLDMSADGSDAFFVTRDQLVAQDQDGLYDVYDARVDGGLSSQVKPPPSDCAADACRGPLAAVPAAPLAATVSFSGPGNATPPPAPAKAGKVTVVKRPVRGTHFTISVKAPAKGRITITGAGIRTARKSVGKAGTFKIEVALTARERRALARKRRLKLALRVTFAPASGSASHVSFSITDKA
ncbi:hypothetical protein [Baekduia sp.]|uniref:hypothetical protein n=1 Tax=Baekduia sp. TaxID=2600305 RepID=UPI002DFFFF95|nr:hypothetical protein [Baekduia sp.]